MSHKHHHGPDEERDPIADYKEWADNRYNPGYFTGGRLSPMVRATQKLFSAREKRVIRILLVVGVVLLVAARLWIWLRPLP